MVRISSSGGSVIALVVALVILLPTGTGSAHGTPLAGTTERGTLLTVQIPGNWTISSTVSYSNTTLDVNGTATIEGGGELRLTNVTLAFSEPTDLAHGLRVGSGGALYANQSTFESSNPGRHFWAEADPGARLALEGGRVIGLGGPGGAAGFIVKASGTSLVGVSFDQYYEALVVENAPGVLIRDCEFGNSTSSDLNSYAVQVTGSSTDLRLTGTSFDIPQFVGALFVAAPNADIENNSFQLNPNSTVDFPVLLGYTGNGRSNASGSRFAYNTVFGSDITDLDSSHVTIDHNKVLDDGGQTYVHSFGIHAQVWYGTGAAVWVNGLTISYNLVSDPSAYGIRIEQNITNFTISYNTIDNASSPTVAPPSFGAQTLFGIYLIRGVTNGLVAHNHIDLKDVGSVDTEGIILESEVSNVTLLANDVFNCSQNAINVQGDWEDSGINIGPSPRNVVRGNVMENFVPVTQTTQVAIAFLNWLWANDTVVEDNSVIGWDRVDSASTYNGAAFLQASSGGTFSGNVVVGATYGFIFSYFAGPVQENHSDNLVYGNELLNISHAAVVNLPSGGMGPIANVIDVLTNARSAVGTPGLYLQSIDATRSLAFTEAAGVYSVTVQTWDPITGAVENFTTGLPWSLPPFAVRLSGDFGSGHLSPTVGPVAPRSVTYSAGATGPIAHLVSLDVPAEQYSAEYSIATGGSGSSNQSFRLNSTEGPASFVTDGAVSAEVNLLSWNATNLSLLVTAGLANGTPVQNVTAEVDLAATGGTSHAIVGPTNASGEATFYGVPPGTEVAGASVVTAGYGLVGYTVDTSETDLIQLHLTLTITGGGGTSGTGGNNSTGSSTNSTGPGGTAPDYPIDFEEHGLGFGTVWWVSVTGNETANLSTDATAIVFYLTNGSYRYLIGAGPGASVASVSGSFRIDGAGSSVNVSFVRVPPAGPSPPSLATTSSADIWSGIVTLFDVLLVLGAVGALSIGCGLIYARTVRRGPSGSRAGDASRSNRPPLHR
jgi:hypothetical protein